MKRHFCQFDPALSFCVVFFPCTRARLEANWRNCNDAADDIALIDRKTLHNVSTPVSRHQSHDIPSHTRQNEKSRHRHHCVRHIERLLTVSRSIG